MKILKTFLIILLISSCGGQVETPVDTDGFRVLNKSSSNVTLTLVSDLRCPSCKKFSEKYLDTIVEKYVKTEKVKFQSVTMPFLGTQSLELSSILKVIEQHEPNNYLKAYKLAFDDGVFSKGSKSYAVAIVESGLFDKDAESLMNLANSSNITGSINQTKEKLIDSGIRSVPALLLNGKPLSLKNLDSLTKQIDKRLDDSVRN